MAFSTTTRSPISIGGRLASASAPFNAALSWDFEQESAARASRVAKERMRRTDVTGGGEPLEALSLVVRALIAKFSASI